MLGSVGEPYPIWAGSERARCAASPSLRCSSSGSPSCPAPLRCPTPLCNRLHRRFRSVDVESIDHEDPPGIGVGGYRPCDAPEAKSPPRCGSDTPIYGGSDRPVPVATSTRSGKRTSGAVAGMLMLLALDRPGAHRERRRANRRAVRLGEPALLVGALIERAPPSSSCRRGASAA